MTRASRNDPDQNRGAAASEASGPLSRSVVHRLQLVPVGSRKKRWQRQGFRAVCSCGWKGRPRPVRGEAGADASDHRLTARYGPS